MELLKMTTDPINATKVPIQWTENNFNDFASAQLDQGWKEILGIIACFSKETEEFKSVKHLNGKKIKELILKQKNTIHILNNAAEEILAKTLSSSEKYANVTSIAQKAFLQKKILGDINTTISNLEEKDFSLIEEAPNFLRHTIYNFFVIRSFIIMKSSENENNSFSNLITASIFSIAQIGLIEVGKSFLAASNYFDIMNPIQKRLKVCKDNIKTANLICQNFIAQEKK